ncbi:MAG: helix-turn-helix transcriptional regulator [Phycisphaerales bacterium]
MIRLQPGNYFGQTTQVRHFGDFRITATRYAPGTFLPTHCHEQAYLLVSLRGATIESAMHRDHVCSRGWVVLNQAGESHCDKISDQGAEALNIELPAAFVAQFGRRLAECPVQYRHAGGALPAVGCLQIAMRSSDPLSRLAVEESVTTIVDYLTDGAASDRVTGAESLQAVEQIIRDRNGLTPSLDSLAAHAGVHPAHLCRQFRRTRGRTMTEFAASVRADRALERVMSTDQPLSQISVECGFSDQAHMTRMFRRFFETTPGRIRREAR